MDKKQVILSGIQPTGKTEDLHIGNYLGTLKNWVDLQYDYNALYMIADLHVITVDFNPSDLAKQRLNFVALLIALGIDPDKSTIFLQSENYYHPEFAWLLNSIAKYGDLQRMTQFKDKSKKHGITDVKTGLLNYPILMASDILLYQTDLVPIGEDQVQHLEFTRNLAESFNKKYGEGQDVLKMPSAYVNKHGARIKRLDDPTKKMSKSDISHLSKISILDTPDQIEKKIKRAVTDSNTTITYDQENRAGLANLIDIYSLCANETISHIEQKYTNKGYKEFKTDLSELLIETLTPFQTKYLKLIQDKSDLQKIAKAGNERSIELSAVTLKRCKELMGFTKI